MAQNAKGPWRASAAKSSDGASGSRVAANMSLFQLIPAMPFAVDPILIDRSWRWKDS